MADSGFDGDKDNDRTKSMGDPDNRPDRPRITRLGPFKIESTLGSGGMGTIYRAYDESMKRPVALKVLHSALEISEQAQTRFVREAWIAGQLDHPNIVKVYSRGEENNVSYLAMELIEGGSLYDYVEKTRESIPSGSDVTATIDQDYIHDILGKFIELSGALEHIHAKGFIHRDVKPQNILLSGEEKRFKFTDFGIAHAQDMSRMTRAGDFIGTVKYMSPELLAAHRAGIDKRTDIYSLGVTLYETLTLTLPFKADSEEKLIGEILAGHYTEARKSNRRIPVDLETVLMKACHHDPSLRYQTAVEFADDLQRIVDGRPIMAKRQGVFSKAVKYVKRNYMSVLGIVATVVVVVGSFLWSFYRLDTIDSAKVDKPTFSMVDVPGLLDYCALSPDGERIVTVSNDSCLWIAPTRGPADSTVPGEFKKLSGPVAYWPTYSYPVWSADGKWIAFNGRGEAEWITSIDQGKRDSAATYRLSVYVIPSTGGDPIELSVRHDGNGGYDSYRLGISPNGKSVAFFSRTSPIQGDSIEDCIYAMTVTGGDIKRLTPSNCAQPAYSPDGTMLAYVKMQVFDTGDSSGAPDIWVVPAEGGDPIRITNSLDHEFGPVWSPDSRMIAFYRWVWGLTGDVFKQLYVVALSESYEPMGPPVAIDLPYDANDFIAGWYSNNEIGIVVKMPFRLAVYTIPASGGLATQVTRSTSFRPHWSQDGERIYYTVDSVFEWVPASGGKGSLIPIMANVIKDCDLSPDGTRLATRYWPDDSTTGTGISIVPLEGGEGTRITSVPLPSYDKSPHWSPDGRLIAFTRSDVHDATYRKELRLCVVPSEGGRVRELVASDDMSGFTGYLTWSPEGDTIAYSSYHSDSLKGISILPFEGGDPETIIEFAPGSGCSDLEWSPDGKKLAYSFWENSEIGDRATSIRVLELDTRKSVTLRMGTKLEVASGGPTWSPDGMKLAFTGERPEKSYLCIIRDFLPED